MQIDFIIYHHRDLDGLTSGALLKEAYPEATLIGYDYCEELELTRFKRKNVIMADVSLPMTQMLTLAKYANEFQWFDHHVSAYNDFRKTFENLRKTNITASILEYFDKELNFYYYYCSKISACELVFRIISKPMFNSIGEVCVRLLGQYDTWRNTHTKKIIGDSDWNETVLPFQWGMREYRTPEILLTKIKSLETHSDIDSVIKIGNSILKYQESIDETNISSKGFEFILNHDGKDLKVIALNGGPFNSRTFESRYHEGLHDLMMPFVFNGKTMKWTFSMYTTKNDVDILSIAKKYGGGGHKQACGFQRDHDEVSFNEGKICFEKQLEIKFILDSNEDVFPLSKKDLENTLDIQIKKEPKLSKGYTRKELIKENSKKEIFHLPVSLSKKFDTAVKEWNFKKFEEKFNQYKISI